MLACSLLKTPPRTQLRNLTSRHEILGRSKALMMARTFILSFFLLWGHISLCNFWGWSALCMHLAACQRSVQRSREEKFLARVVSLVTGFQSTLYANTKNIQLRKAFTKCAGLQSQNRQGAAGCMHSLTLGSAACRGLISVLATTTDVGHSERRKHGPVLTQNACFYPNCSLKS